MRASTATAIAGLFTVLLVTSCGVSSEDEPRALPPEAAGALTSPTPAKADSTATRFMALWFVQERRLVQVDRATDKLPTPDQQIAALEAGPTQPELDVGMRTAVISVVPDTPLLTSADAARVPVEQQPGQVAVVLSKEFDSLPSQEQQLVLGQVVTTLTDGDTQAVLFVDADGVAVGVPLPDGRLVNRPVTARDYRSLRN